MFQSVPNTALFVVQFALHGTEAAQFGVYVNNDVSPWDATQLEQKCQDIRDVITSDYLPLLSSDHDFIGVVGRDLEVEFGRVEQVIEPAPVAGGLASPSLPGNVAVCVTFRAAVGPPRNGRIYLMPPGESQVTGDLLTGGAQTALQEAMEALAAAASSDPGNSHVIVSRHAGTALVEYPDGQTLKKPVKRAAGVVADVADVRVNQRTDSMRRRLIKEPA